MTGIKGVALTLRPLRKAAHAAVFTQLIKSFPAPGQELMRIGLMPHVPDDLILRQVSHEVERHRKLHSPQIGAQMPTGLTDLIDQEFPDLLCQRIVLLGLDILYVVGFLYSVQYHLLCPAQNERRRKLV